MKEWRIETVPINQCEDIFTTHIDNTENGMFYVINGDEGYDLSMWTPEEAENDYLSPKAKEAREVAFMKAFGFYD